ncbi:transcription elongation factor, mitochondrial [Ptiloglossa arizonensis]|uniref:transcription elongation factor, mitochondrial n=1 Tax=Ptiloglossa arizonensis TaxID=3350558 RepID=UPI003FA02FFE
MLRTLRNFIYKADSQKKLCIRLSLINCRLFQDKSFRFTRETKILQIANEGTEEQLQKFIELSHAKSIILHRIQNGPYKSLLDLLLINKFEHNIAQRFCNAICPEKLTKMNKYTVVPNIKMEELPDTVLGIHVGPTLVSWALIDRDFNLLNWNYETWYDCRPRNNSYHLIEMVPSIVKKIPKSSAYIMEDIQLIRNTITPNILYLQQQFIVSIMVCVALRDGNDVPCVNNVYVFKPKTTARFFKLLLGSEIIGAQYVVHVTSTFNQIEIRDMASINMCISDDGKRKYMRGSSDVQEQMRWSLLKALSFFHIAEMQNNFEKKKTD